MIEPWNQRSDFLSEETRKQRRNLDIVAVLSILVLWLHLVPNRISAVGVDFGPTRKQSFLIILLVFDLWFVVRFLVYALADFNEFRNRLDVAQEAEGTFLESQEARKKAITNLLQRAREGYEGHPSELAREIDSQVFELAREQLRWRTVIALRRFGLMRLVVDLAVPLLLGLAAFGWLVTRLT